MADFNLRQEIDALRARQLHFEPFLQRLAPPASPIVDVARAINPRATPIPVQAPSLEAPSALMVYRWAMWHAGHDDPPDVTFAEIPDPDPRESLIEKPVWTYREPGLLGRLTEHARPAVLPPRKKVYKEVAALAAQPYQIDRWAEVARDFDAYSDELRALMVHPPDPPEGIAVWDWVFRVQVAAALSVAWEDGELEPLLDGPVDWTTTAAIIALTQRAREQPELRPAALESLEPFLEEPAGPIYFHCMYLPAVRCALYLDPPAALREELGRLWPDDHPFR